jgi:hypothetical protein
VRDVSSPDDDKQDPEKVLSVDDVKTTVIHEHVPPDPGGGPIGGGAPTGGPGPGDDPSGGSPGGSSSEEPVVVVAPQTNFKAMCDELHPPPPPTQFIGPVRKGSNAFQDAQKDADEHNRKFPGHRAGPVED